MARSRTEPRSPGARLPGAGIRSGSARPVDRPIPPEPHTAMYVWHKYWSRKTWNVVAEHIKGCAKPNEVVFDPFAGSGVVAVEAARNRRKAIVCDLNPAAMRIAELTLRPVNVSDLRAAFERVRSRAQRRIAALYSVRCLHCGGPLVADCFVREGEELVEVRYKACPHCGHRCETGCAPGAEDLEALAELEGQPIQEWHPANELGYEDGTPFLKRERYESLDQLFTRRNLRAAALLYEALGQERDATMRRFLIGAFTSMIHLCARICPALEPGAGNHQTAFSSTWTQHSYWSARRSLEANVWARFESAVLGHQGLVRAKEESNQALGKVRLTEDWREVLDGRADVALVTGDCLELMRRLPEGCVDYLLTDPPYDASIQYGELSYLWNAWLKEDAHYTRRILRHEVVRNERQRKPFAAYDALLSRSFRGFHRVLRPGRRVTLTFHNPAFRVRNAAVRAGVAAGFNYEHIYHQPLGQVSAKAMLQPFGSAQGDFYLRFRKTSRPARPMTEISRERFRRIVVETCRRVIARRAEPTPYTVLINELDPVLARRGLCGASQTGLEVKTVLQENLGRVFVLVEAKLGAASGRLWWLADARRGP